MKKKKIKQLPLLTDVFFIYKDNKIIDCTGEGCLGKTYYHKITYHERCESPTVIH